MFPSPRGTWWRSSNFDRRVLAPAYHAAGWRDAHGDGHLDLAQPAARVLHHRPVRLAPRTRRRLLHGRPRHRPRHPRHVRRRHRRRPGPRPHRHPIASDGSLVPPRRKQAAPVPALLRRRVSATRPVENRSISRQLRCVGGLVSCGDRWETRCYDGSETAARSGRPAGVAVGCCAVVRRRAAGLCRAGRRGTAGAGVRCFYDADEQIELWGKHLAEELPPSTVVGTGWFSLLGYRGFRHHPGRARGEAGPPDVTRT